MSSTHSNTSARLALLSVWIALLSLLLALAMLVYRPAMTDGGIIAVLYFGSPGALCLAGLVLWSFRKESDSDPAVNAQRVQGKAAMVMAILAAGIVYGLIIFSHKLDPSVLRVVQTPAVFACVGHPRAAFWAG